MDYEDTYQVMAPEGLVVGFTLAGVGSRFTAFALDSVLQLLVTLALYILALIIGGAISLAVVIVGAFVVQLGYWVIFETLGNGRTVGKRLTHLRVMSFDGASPSFRQSATRTLLRLLDGLPGAYLIGVIVILVTRENQRLGDLAANTLVVREQTRLGRIRGASGVPDDGAPNDGAPNDGAPNDGAPNDGAPNDGAPNDGVSADGVVEHDVSGWDVSAVSDEVLATIAGFLDRRQSLLRPARQRLATELAEQMRAQVWSPGGSQEDERFLENVYAAAQQRRARPV